jgi:heptosyltransferase-2
MTTIVVAPNWLGDAVMALPAIADIRRHVPGRLIVAARPALAALFDIVPGVDATVVLHGTGRFGLVRHVRSDAEALRRVGADRAILLPNSFRSALVAALARVPERWGYRRDFRGALLTHAVPTPGTTLHQVDYYRHLAKQCGAVGDDPREPSLDPPASAIDAARSLLAGAGWIADTPLVALAPGAAYGGAKRWPAAHFASAIARICQQTGATCVMVGTGADARVAREVEAELGKITRPPARGRLLNLTGRTDLRQLAGLLALCRAFVSNDSGAMHLAAAVGTPVVALFGPTDEHATAPLVRAADRLALLTAPAWCRPCLLRECPLDHRCLERLDPSAVVGAIQKWV